MMMVEWPKVNLACCVELLAGFPFKSEHYTDNPDDVALVKGENVSQGHILWEISKRWRVADFTQLQKFELVPGDVVVAMDRPWVPAGLKWAYIREGDPQALLVQRCARLRSKHESLNQDFLRFVIGGSGFESYVKPITTGVNIPHISGKQILDYEFTLPPLPEQRRIAGILSTYDDLIENNQRRIRILEDMARRLYREWFVHFRYPGHESVPFADSPLGQIPQGWEVKKLGDVAATFRGRSYRSVDLADEGGFPFLNLKCLDRDGGFRRSGLKRYIGEFKETHLAKKGDIVMAVTDMTQERRIVARAALVPSLDNEFGVFSMDLVRIEPKGEMPKSFLYSFLRYSSFADEVKQHANGANVLHLSPERITDFRFSAPPVDLMERFVRFVAPALEQMDVLQNQTANLRRTRDLLLPRLLSGKVHLLPEDVA